MKHFQHLVKFLENIIKSDRKQPEFIEKTNVYVSKRVTPIKVITGKKIIILDLDPQHIRICTLTDPGTFPVMPSIYNKYHQILFIHKKKNYQR